MRTGKYGGRVVTRFPPEPNGYLHYGHAKSICLNFGLAAENDGVCHLRFDDTNPAKEDVEFEDSIADSVRWLGFDWGVHRYHASDYYDRLYAFAEWFIGQGLAYVDSQSAAEVRAIARHADPARRRLRRIATGPSPKTSISSAGCGPASFPTARTCCASRSTWRARTSTCATRRSTGSATSRTTAPATSGASTRSTTTRTASRMRWSASPTRSARSNSRTTGRSTTG